MKDFAKKINLEEVKPFAIKGHTRIELTSVLTGEKKVVEHDNVFQSAIIAKQLRSLGRYNNAPWVNSDWDSQARWVSLVGGIFLFEDAIDVSGGDVEYMPAGNKMIGNGAYNIVNSDVPVELGSFNSIESSTGGANSLTLVYDFATSQANGTISCVCLTSYIGGQIGYGNGSGGVKTSGVVYSDMNQNLQYRDGIPYNNLAYEFTVDNTAKTLTVRKVQSAVTQTSIFEKREKSTVTLSFTNALTTYENRFRAVYLGSGKFAIFGVGTSATGVGITNRKIPNGSTYRFLIYDATNDTVTEKELTNDSGEDLLVASGAFVFMPTADTDRIIFPIGDFGTSSTITGAVEFSMSTLRAVETYNFGRTLTLTADRYGHFHCLCEGLYVIGNQIVDTVAKTSAPINGGIAGTLHWDYDALLYNAGETNTNGVDSMGRMMHKNPLYLATVNNLQTAVVKDATQTMKVIYTLTEA